MSKPRVAILCIIGILLFGGGYYLGSQNNSIPANVLSYTITNKETSVPIDFSLFWNVWNTLTKRYIAQPVDQNKLFYGAIKGMVEALGDPYSSFLDPTETKNFADELNSEFEGVGIEIGMKNDRITVIAPIPGAPAETVGLRSRDWIVAIDDESTAEMSLIEAVHRIRGERGTNVKLTVSRNQEEPFEVNITRQIINVPTVTVTDRGSGLYQVQISSFSNDSVSDFKSVARDLVAKNARGILLDLRNNPGGLLDASVDIASEFVEPQTTVVIEHFIEEDDKLFKADSNAQHFIDIPTVILINEGSASASEILAGALREIRGIKLVGVASYGKGTVQQYETLSQKTSLRLTVAEWHLPSNNKIPSDGLKPDIEVQLTSDDFNNDRDPQLQKGLEVLQSLIQ